MPATGPGSGEASPSRQPQDTLPAGLPRNSPPEGGLPRGVARASDVSSRATLQDARERPLASNKSKPAVVSTNAPGHPHRHSAENETTLGVFDLQLVKFLHDTIKWTYLL